MHIKSFLLCLSVGVLTLCFSSSSGQSQNVYCVGPAASGNGSGSDWNNVKGWSSSPNRGDTWYLEGGTYPGETFSVADNGSLITIKKAIASDHVTSTGWTSAMAAQAVFASGLTFTTGNWVFDGQVPQNTNWDQNAADYGFAFTAQLCNDIHLGPSASGTATNYVIAHFSSPGYSGDPASGSCGGNAFCISTTSASSEVDNVTVSNCLMNDWQNDVATTAQTDKNWLVQGNVMLNTAYYSDAHSECISENYGTAQYITIRYNLFQNDTGTAIIVPALNGTGANSNWYIYGNVFKGCSSGGNGIIGTGSGGVSCTGVYIYNNTFDSCTGGWLNNLDASAGSVLTGNAENNLFYNMNAGGVPSGFGTVDYSAYFSCSGNNGDAHLQTGSGNPFVNEAGDIYELVTNTIAGANLGAPYNVDPAGNTRTTWTRGAYEFTGGNTNPPPVDPVIQVTPGSVSYGTVAVGAGGTNQFVVQNVGTGTLSGSASASAPFSVVAGASYSLAAGQTQTVVVAFNPGSAGSYSQNVTLTGGGGASVGVSGSATNVLLPAAIQVVPGSLAFGVILSGTSKTNSFAVSNVGGGTLSGSASASAPFSVVAGASYSLAAGQTQTVVVAFNPGSAGSYSQNVTLTGGGGASVGVSGSATNVLLPAAIQAVPGSLAFGVILSGTSKTNSFAVSNVGGGTLSGTASVGSPFSIVSGGSYNLGSNQSQTVVVAFNPGSAGSYSQNVTLTGGGGASVGVSGSATNALLPAAIQVVPGSLAFGTVLMGADPTNSFVVSNVGGGTLSGTASVGSPFSIVSGGSYNLGSNQSQTVVVAFNPGSAGSYSQNVTLTGGGGASVSVRGSATNAPVLPAVSAISVDATDVDLSLPGLQVYSGTTVQFSAVATNAQTWQWSYTVNGSSPVIYTNSTSPITNISYYFDTNTVGNSYLWTLVVSNGQAWAESQTNLQVETAPAPGGTVTTNVGLTFMATSAPLSGLLTASTMINGVPTSYIYQPLPSIGDISGGTAVYNFTVTNAGNYEIQALVDAPSVNANSFLVNIDGQPQIPTMIWDILPVTSGFEQRLVSWRGNGSQNNDQIIPKIFSLSAGQHQIIFVGGQPGTAMASFTLLQVVTSVQSQLGSASSVQLQSPLAAPSGLRILSSGPYNQ